MAARAAVSHITFSNILYLTDFSQPSEAALPFVASVARGYGSSVHALHVLMPPMFGYTSPALIDPATEVWDQRAREDMDRVSSYLAGLPHECLVERGPEIWPPVANAIRQHDIDLIVIGTHGRTGAQRLLLGSVAEEIFRLAPMPVLTIGPEIHTEPHNDAKFRRILFATDFSRASVAAVPYAFSLAEENNAKIYTLNVIRTRSHAAEKMGSKESAAEAMERLHGLCTEEDEVWCRPHAIVRYGEPGREILNVSRELGADLIVIGVRGGTHPGAAAHVKRATAHNVVARAGCPVLTVAERVAETAA
jgi:nucleotide-binding universal stress UspA family protein